MIRITLIALGLTLGLLTTTQAQDKAPLFTAVRRQNNLDELGFRIAESLAHLG